ncbi:hypothetical protein [Nocardioides sp. B-3]|uniref:hypothetical protein n=1 Tax=Nocardioides sp. B-3 TaxID=2895565 RepID=UPI002153762F|nr:hypothetical protein [Nocardioides sp. B-3]UUZ59182.1 hypothetical protein LP418_25205 [Nocardioides sp. B-3]
MKLFRALILPAPGTIVFLSSLVGAPAHASLSRVPTKAPVSAADSGAAFESKVMVEINDARARFGLKPVRFFDSCVERMATSPGQPHRDDRHLRPPRPARGPAQVQPVPGRREPHPRHRAHGPRHRRRPAQLPLAPRRAPQGPRDPRRHGGRDRRPGPSGRRPQRRRRTLIHA